MIKYAIYKDVVISLAAKNYKIDVQKYYPVEYEAYTKVYFDECFHVAQPQNKDEFFDMEDIMDYAILRMEEKAEDWSWEGDDNGRAYSLFPNEDVPNREYDFEGGGQYDGYARQDRITLYHREITKEEYDQLKPLYDKTKVEWDSIQHQMSRGR